MCGIAGVIHRDGAADLGAELTKMLHSMKHRGPDSTGYALYGPPDDLVVIRFVLAEPNELGGFGVDERLERSRVEVESRLAKIGAEVAQVTSETGYAFRATVRYAGDLKSLADYLEDIPGCEVLSLGNSLEIVKDLGDAETVGDQYGLAAFRGTHGIGHVRMATASFAIIHLWYFESQVGQPLGALFIDPDVSIRIRMFGGATPPTPPKSVRSVDPAWADGGPSRISVNMNSEARGA